MRTVYVCLCALLFPAVMFAQRDPSKPSAPSPTEVEKNSTALPVKKVILYKNGVGYFERVGLVRGNQDLRI